MLKIYKSRPAIAMIELIFAIVIMGIILLSAPMLITQSSKSNTVVFQQESISMLAAHTGALMTYFWDENNVMDNAILSTNGNTDLDGNNSRTAIGNIAKGRNPSTLLNASIAMGIEVSTGTNDVDDFNGTSKTLELDVDSTESTINGGEYIDTNITIATALTYGRDDGPDGSSLNITFSNPFTPYIRTSNIKLIQTTLGTTAIATELQKNIVLHAFMCNIGGATLDKRSGL